MINYDGLYCSETYKETFDTNPFSEKELHFKVIENGTILPHKKLATNDRRYFWGVGGIVDSKGNWIKESFVVDGVGLGAYTPENEVPFFDTTVIYLTMYFSTWGHIITDEIRRAWFFKTDVYKKQFSSCPIIVNPWNITGGGWDTTPIYKIA